MFCLPTYLLCVLYTYVDIRGFLFIQKKHKRLILLAGLVLHGKFRREGGGEAGRNIHSLVTVNAFFQKVP